MAGAIPDELLLSRIRKETAAREAALAALQAQLEAANAEMQQKITAAASKLSAQINGATVNASAIAGQILRTQVEPGFALAEELTLLEAKVTDGQNTSAASIEELRTTTATQYESIAQQTLTIKAQFNGNVAFLQDQITANATAISAAVTHINTLDATVSNPTTGLVAAHSRITTEETVRATQTSALATRTTTLESSVNDPTTGLSATLARLVTEETTRATQTSALATRATSLEATVFSGTDGNTALKSRIATEETARANADTALASSISTVSATASGKNKTFYQSSAPTASAAGDLWIDTTGSTNAVKRWDGSSWVDTQVAAGAIGAAVSAESSARATADGNLSGKYSLKVIAGNVVTGMNITSSTGGGTDVSDITFQAASFKVYNGTTGVAPFQVVGGQVKVTGSLVISSGDVSGLGSLATASSVDLSTSQVTNKSLANLDSSANTKLAGIAANADVTLAAINGGLTITSGGLTLSGTPSIQSSNYSATSAGWAIKGDGSVEFNSGTFRGSLDVGTGLNRTQINTGGLTVGDINLKKVVYGGSIDQSTIYITSPTSSGVYSQVSMTAGNVSTALRVAKFDTSNNLLAEAYTLSDGFYQTGGSLKLDSSGRWALSAGTSRSIALNANGLDRWYVGSDGHFKSNGGDIRKVSSDGWTPTLFDGDNSISFQWNGGNLYVKVDTTVFTLI